MDFMRVPGRKTTRGIDEVLQWDSWKITGTEASVAMIMFITGDIREIPVL